MLVGIPPFKYGRISWWEVSHGLKLAKLRGQMVVLLCLRLLVKPVLGHGVETHLREALHFLLILRIHQKWLYRKGLLLVCVHHKF